MTHEKILTIDAYCPGCGEKPVHIAKSETAISLLDYRTMPAPQYQTICCRTIVTITAHFDGGTISHVEVTKP